MSTVYTLPEVSPATVKNTVSLLRILALALISGAAIASRLFAVVNFESIIHELYVFYFYKYQRNLILVRTLSVIPGSTSELIRSLWNDIKQPCIVEQQRC